MVPSKIRRVRVSTRLSVALRDRLSKHCAASGLSERAVIEDALRQHLDGTSGWGAHLAASRPTRPGHGTRSPRPRALVGWVRDSHSGRPRGRQAGRSASRGGPMEAVCSAPRRPFLGWPPLHRRVAARRRRRRGRAGARTGWVGVGSTGESEVRGGAQRIRWPKYQLTSRD